MKLAALLSVNTVVQHHPTSHAYRRPRCPALPPDALAKVRHILAPLT